MSDIEATNLPTEPTAEVADPNAELPPETATDGEQPQGQAQPVEDDHEEVEREGQKYRIPKALKGEFLMQQDYTRKTQEVAETRKSLEAELTQVRKFNDDMINAKAEVVSLDKTLAQYQQVDWNALASQDPVKAQQLWIDYSQLKERRQQAVQQYGQAEHQLTLKSQQEFAKRVEETKGVIQRDIHGWSPELENNLFGFAKTIGFPDDRIKLAMATDPASVKLLHMAYQASQMLKKATQPPQAPAVTPKPVPKVSGAAKADKDPSEMTDKEFAAWRRRQIAQRR